MPGWSWTDRARAAALLLGLSPGFAGAGDLAAPPAPQAVPAVEATSYLLIDQGCGWSLGAREARRKIDPGSLARLMTVYLVLEQLHFGADTLDTEITAATADGADAAPRLYLAAGERITLGELARAVAVAGAADAAHALAVHFAGGDSQFVDLMNAAARTLGLDDTRFAGPLSGAGARSSARDMAQLAIRLASAHPGAFAWFSQRRYVHAGLEHHNSNPLLWLDSHADGVAHGTNGAGQHLLIASSLRAGRRVFAVVTGSASAEAVARDAVRLLEYGFRAYESRAVVAAGAVAARIPLGHDDGRLVPVGLEADLFACVPRGTFDQVFAQVAVRASVEPPVEQGAALGELTLRYRGSALLAQPLVALQPTPARENWWQHWFH